MRACRLKARVLPSDRARVVTQYQVTGKFMFPCESELRKSLAIKIRLRVETGTDLRMTGLVCGL